MKQDFYWICWWLFAIFGALVYIAKRADRIAEALEQMVQVAK